MTGLPAVRVMVVDDQEPFRRAASAMVEATDGFTVVGFATDGEQSVTLAQELRPDLVLMDVVLPGLDGLEATRRIRRLDFPPAVVLVSTYEPHEIGIDAIELGASAFVPKGEFDSARLREVWQEVRRGEG